MLETKTKFDEIQIYLEDDLTNADYDRIENSIRDMEGVLSLVFISKEQGLEIMKEGWEEEAYLLKGLEENPLQSSYIIQLWISNMQMP